MNMFAMFNENPAMTLQDIKETKRYGWTGAQTDNEKTLYPPLTKFAGGIMNNVNMTRNYHNNQSQIHPRHREEETQNTDSYTIKVKQHTLFWRKQYPPRLG